MKKKNFITKHFGKIGLLFGFAFVLGCGVMSLHEQDQVQPQLNEVSNIQKNRQLVSYDKTSYTVSYDSDDFIDNETNFNLWLSIHDSLFSAEYNNTNKLDLTGTCTYNSNDVSVTKVWAEGASNQWPKQVYFNVTGGYRYGLEIEENSRLVIINDELRGINTLFTSLSLTSEVYYNLVVPPTDDFGAVVSDFLEILVGGIIDLGTGIASGVVSMASALFLNVDVSTGNVTGLSTFGGILAIFAGLALAVGITTKVYEWVTSLGN